MPTIELSSLSALLSTPLVLPAFVAGAIAALFVVLTVLALRRPGSGMPRLLLGIASLALVGLAVIVVLDRLALNERVAEQRAILARAAELNRSALAPGSALACLDAGAGDAVESACEKALFASAQSTAAAVAYMDARLNLLAAAADDGDAGIAAALASTRRAVTLDRFGVAAHVLAARDGCTADKCAGFALVGDASALKANLKAQVFDQYVSRYAAVWNTPQPKETPPPDIPAAPPVASAASPAAPVTAIKPGEQWEYPSAASIPPVSIMNKEPPVLKGAEAAPPADEAWPAVKPPPIAASAAPPLPPLPPKRPQPQAPPPPAR